MAKRIGGMRRKTRYKFKKERREKGKVSMTNYFQSFSVGDKVYLGVEPAIQKGMYHPRFVGKAGIIAGKVGRCYEVTIKDINKAKMLVVHPVHLRRV
ncbi:MAG: 50S ribosomal protein L21e [Nanoarchaeota archaeon]